MYKLYCIENMTNGKKYIGSTKNLMRRKNSHFSALRHNKHTIKELQDDYNHGHSIEFYILDDLDGISNKESVLYIEGMYIMKYNTVDNGYNSNTNAIYMPYSFLPKHPEVKKYIFPEVWLNNFNEGRIGFLVLKKIADAINYQITVDMVPADVNKD